METNAEWRQLGAVVGDVMERLQARRQEQQRFIAESRREVLARALAPKRLRAAPGSSEPVSRQPVARQMELPLYMTHDARVSADRASM